MDILTIKNDMKDWVKIIKPYQEANTNKAIVQILNSFLPFIAVWCLMYFAYAISYWYVLALAMLNSLFLVRIFIIQHDCGHYSFFESRKWNKIIGTMCSLLTTIPFKYWARVHSFHHGHVGQLENRNVGDINVLTVKEYHSLPSLRKFYYRIFRNPLFIFVVAPTVYLSISNRLPFMIFQKGWKELFWGQLFNNLGLVAFYGILSYFLGWKVVLGIHLPIVFFFGIIAFWFFYIQHTHEHTYMEEQKNWDYLIASLKSSTYYKLPKLWQWFTGNIGFHHIHHLSSKIPNYNLEKCAKENPILQKYVTILTFKESLKCMFYTLWDEQQGKMISFRDYYAMY